eukprot:TRINITY_DN3626_c0_g1_i1.p1 TRINITY_DN3626_c0_g1~~TRINITY_DN3626_c0_g1_i1.p1  ORF type:complete len:466 (+),score=66.74 TRINITY_DN3626_c0_g1_i1:72-1469(+)
MLAFVPSSANHGAATTLGRWTPDGAYPQQSSMRLSAETSAENSGGLSEAPWATTFAGAACLSTFMLLRRQWRKRRESSRWTLPTYRSRSCRKVTASEGSTGTALADVTGVPPILVVNLDQSKDRWEQTQEELATQDLTAERWSATYGKHLSPDELHDKANFLGRNFNTPGMVGCFCSHNAIWNEVVRRGLPRAIVFEDDVLLLPDFPQKLATLQKELDELKDGWDVCLLGAIGCINPVKEPFAMRFYELGPGGGRPQPKGYKTRTLSEHLFVPHRPAGTHAYMISQSGAQKLAKLMPRARYHVDLAAWGVKDLNLVMANPSIASQRFDEGGATSTVAKDGSSTERLLMWIWEASGLAAMGRAGGCTNMSWAWRTAVFALPLKPWKKWPQSVVPISQGPAVCLLMSLFFLAAVLRSPALAAFAFFYLCLCSSLIRACSGGWSWRVFLVELSAIAYFARLSALRLLY